MSSLHRLNAIQNELREVLSISKSDIQLNAHELEIGEEVRARFIGLQLSSVFQPIIDLRKSKPIGFEALLRAQNLKAQNVTPQEAFRQAEIAERLVKFDRLCRTLHTLNYLNMGMRDQLLFLNVHPDLLVAVNSHGKVFEQVLHNHAVQTSDVVIEINESAVAEHELLRLAIANYRERGYRIAIDNFGRVHTNLERLWKLEPDFVKLDGHLIQQTEQNSRLQSILPKLVELIHDLGGKVIAQGVETQAQMELVSYAGIVWAQGNALGKPAPASAWGSG
ncbi:EAL domain-containing protein [Ferriphaselus sp. R-1]|uniref:EAL domain-containing protein n=1 Tax=Ferriphaselus sp. R-1 TaxID=1485544 RepID=UPI00054E119C|nr:EAL domain-containing protein [Ferriphaselus sp. R-1]